MEYVAKGKLQELLRKSRAEQYYGNLHGTIKSIFLSFCFSYLDYVRKFCIHFYCTILHQHYRDKALLLTFGQITEVEHILLYILLCTETRIN
jgi:hypothetical protein